MYSITFFIIQYTHQLRGHIDELKWQVEQMERSALLSGKNLDEYILKFMQNMDRDFANQGIMMREVTHRFEKLSHAWMQLKKSSIFTRPFIFFRHLQFDIISATFIQFKMGIAFTLESLMFGLIGIFFGSGLCFLISVFFNKKITFDSINNIERKVTRI